MRQTARMLLTSAFGAALVLIPAWPVQAQSPTPQTTLAQYVAALQKTPTDSALRERIIKLAQEMKPAPVVPEEAKGLMASGTSLFTTARAPDDFRKAAAEFEKAILAAPWLAEAYYNLGSAQEKAGLLYEAAESLRLYLLAAPGASDAKVVSAHLNGLQQGLLKQFLADLQKTPTNDALREKIIRLVPMMNPPPAIPEEARRHYVMAVTLFSAAKRAEDFGGSIDEFKGALLVAPWWPEANQNLGLALEAAQRYDEAIAALKLYLATSPAAGAPRRSIALLPSPPGAGGVLAGASGGGGGRPLHPFDPISRQRIFHLPAPFGCIFRYSRSRNAGHLIPKCSLAFVPKSLTTYT